MTGLRYTSTAALLRLVAQSVSEPSRAAAQAELDRRRTEALWARGRARMTRTEQAYWQRRAEFRAQCDANAGALRAYLNTPAGQAEVARLNAAFRLVEAQQQVSDNEHGA